MRAFCVRLPSGTRYWTVLDEDLAVVAVADSFLRQLRFGRDGAESTTKSYAHSIALFLRWCARTGRTWHAGAEQLALFMTWLAHAGPSVCGVDESSSVVLAGPGGVPARGARRINGVLTAVRAMVVHAVDELDTRISSFGQLFAAAQGPWTDRKNPYGRQLLVPPAPAEDRRRFEGPGVYREVK